MLENLSNFPRFFSSYFKKTDKSNQNYIKIQKMGNNGSKDEPNQSNTNVGLVNLSENSTSVGIAEVLMGIILLILLWFVLKWCCKRHRRSNERRERNLEEMIQRVESRPSAPVPALPALPQVPVMIPAVSFEHPGDRVVFMKSG